MAISSQDIAIAAEALNRVPGLSSLARRVGIELINHTDRKSGTAWPSEARLAEALNVTDRGIRKAKAQLKAYGFITWKQRGRSPAGRTPLYRIAWERLKQLAADIKSRVTKAAEPYRKPICQVLGRNKRSGYLTQFSYISVEGLQKAPHGVYKNPIQNPTVLKQRASARLYEALRGLPRPVFSIVMDAITIGMEEKAVEAEQFKPQTGLPTLLSLLKQSNNTVFREQYAHAREAGAV